MVAIPQWLKTESDPAEQIHRSRDPLMPQGSRERPEETGDSSYSSDIPIFCAGGCGEVVGYLPKGPKGVSHNGKGRRCPQCEAASLAKRRIAEEAKPFFACTDELAGLVKPPRDLAWLRLIQAAAVAVIIAGSACIAMGRVVGIYLAALGTLAWFISCLILWKMRD